MPDVALHPIKRLGKLIPLVVAVAGLSGCMTIQPLEPVINPPSQFQFDLTVPVEFLAPPMVGLRCAERGAKFLGLPGVNSMACSDTTLVTFADPCLTLTAGWYAQTLCHEIAVAKGEPDAEAPAQTAALETPRASAPASNAVLVYAALQLPAASSRAQTPDLTPGSSTVGDVAEPVRLVSEAMLPNSQPCHADRRRMTDCGLFPTAAAHTDRQPHATPVRVEFIAPARIAYRCAERGAKFVAASTTGACADQELITMPNPCVTDAAGWYAHTLCHELAHANGWAADHTGGSYFVKYAAIQPASQSPQALAAAATRTTAAVPDLAPVALKLPLLAAAPGAEATPDVVELANASMIDAPGIVSVAAWLEVLLEQPDFGNAVADTTADTETPAVRTRAESAHVDAAASVALNQLDSSTPTLRSHIGG